MSGEDKYLIDGEPSKQLIEVGKRLEEILLTGGCLVGDEARIYYRYLLMKAEKRLRSLSEPVLKIFTEVLKLYSITIPLYIVSEKAIEEVFGEKLVIKALLDDTWNPSKPIAIVLNSDYVEERFRSIHKSRIKTLLYMVGRIVFKDELTILTETLLKELSKKNISQEETAQIIQLTINGRLSRWVRKQYSILKRYMNKKMDGWKRGLTFQDIARTFNPEIDKWRDIFKPPKEVYNGPWPPKIERKPRNIVFTKTTMEEDEAPLVIRIVNDSADREGEALPAAEEVK